MTEDPTQLAVIWFSDQWRLVTQNGAWGSFQARADAEEAALRLAAQVEAQGDQVRLLVQQPYGELLPLRPACQPSAGRA
jgi:hypothetical protein